MAWLQARESYQAGYGEGYAAGKAKAHTELRRWRPALHAARCGCELCQTARAVRAGGPDG